MRHTFAAFVFAGFGALSSAHAEVVFNGGFETGDFLGWNVPPNVPNQALFFVAPGAAHSGLYYGRLSSTQLRFISQVLPTQAGTDYELSFWLRRPVNAADGFLIRWEGSVVFNDVFQLPSANEWYEFTVPLHANITGSFLEFGQATFPLEWHIDDISVVQVPGPGSAAVFVMAGACAGRRKRR